jgi:hypothetical protein
VSAAVKHQAPEPKLAGRQLLGAGPVAVACIAVVASLIAADVFGISGAPSPQQGDRISSADIARLAEGFRNGHGALMPVDISTEQQRTEVLNALRVPRAQAERLLAMVERGERALGWLTLWDNFDEDGDVASVTAAGFTQQVPLFHAPTRILVPYIPGQPVFVTGERDGRGGGVTVAVELSTGPLPLPPLAVGQTVTLPLQ